MQVLEIGERGVRRIVAAVRGQRVAGLEDVDVGVDRSLGQDHLGLAGIAIRRQAIPDLSGHRLPSSDRCRLVPRCCGGRGGLVSNDRLSCNRADQGRTRRSHAGLPGPRRSLTPRPRHREVRSVIGLASSLQPVLQAVEVDDHGPGVERHLMLKRTGTTNDKALSGALPGGLGIGWARASMSRVS